MSTTTYTAVSPDKIDTLDSSTLGIIELARALLTDKQQLPKAEFNKIIQSFGWGKGLVQRYIKIAQAFADVEISKLARIEPHTLFKITSTKKFASVVESIKNSAGHITQQLVENLIGTLVAPRIAKSDKPTIWRAEKDGSRSCVVPPIKEDDQFTGMCIQEAMDGEGMTPQGFVREAAAFREAWLCGAFLLVGELPPHLQAILGDKLEYVPPTPVDNIEVKTSDEQSETDKTTAEVAEVVETMEIEVLEVVEPIEPPDESEKRRITATKEASQTIPFIKVGDKVNWANHYPYLSAWLPLEVQEINNGQVKLELCDFLIPIEELSLVL
jgi:hypothetical protein